MKDSYVKIRISEDEKQLLKNVADSNNMTMSEYLLLLIRLDRNQNNMIEKDKCCCK